ncbi:integrase catalytic domain-containing protein [Trichonephila clavipes]|nr:integrase catalytic domain-containing protein [Trichonephila clavipes]
MDDLLTGADDLQSGRKLQVQLVSMLKSAGMELHKWSASNPLLLPDSMCQSLWQLKLDWNDPLPSNLVSYWKSFIDALESINCLDIPRYCLQDKSIRTELHGFSLTRLKRFTYKELEPYDITAVEGDDIFLQELKETSYFPLCALLKNFESLYIINNCSSCTTKLQRVIAWCKRFIENARHPMSRIMGPLKSKELSESLKCIIKSIQRTSFYNEIQYLEKGIPLPNSCKLLNLHPFLDDSGLLRVGGQKVSAKGSQQLMADFPAARVTACRVFSQVVKAIHLEIISDLTTEAFLAALKRFVDRRGRPIEIHSDNGRNFVGANNELRKTLTALFKGKMEEIMDFLSKDQIKWNFNPPSTPHFGGLWEVGVKSLKYHLKRVIGNSILSHEEFLTLVAQTEAVLNSRPICPLSNDPNDVETLTPAHFLVGSSLVARKWSSEYLNRLQQRPKWCKGNEGFKEGDLVLVKPSENSDSLKWNLARILKLHPGVRSPWSISVRAEDPEHYIGSSSSVALCREESAVLQQLLL